MSPVAEEKGPDQREDASFARTGAPLQQGAQTISSTFLSSDLDFLSNLISVLTVVLIPTIAQTDKASILDEAIEYLKSLQMQVQVGNGLPIDLHMCNIVSFDHHRFSSFAVSACNFSVSCCSDHVDEYWDGAHDAPRCSPTHASNEHGLKFSLYATGGAIPQSDSGSTTLPQ